ncbi:MAG: hypothetical protein WKG07_11085 [Hymenobacter sp.]
MLVTTNLEQTFQPVGNAPNGRYASLSLFAIDPASGELTAAGDFAFDGLLPESAVLTTAAGGWPWPTSRPERPDRARQPRFWRVVGAVHDPNRSG